MFFLRFSTAKQTDTGENIIFLAV